MHITFFIYLAQTVILLFVHVGPNVEHTYFHFDLCGRLFVLCSFGVHEYAQYVIVGNTQELYTCIFSHIAKLPFEESPVFRMYRPTCYDSSLYWYLFVLVLFLEVAVLPREYVAVI